MSACLPRLYLHLPKVLQLWNSATTHWLHQNHFSSGVVLCTSSPTNTYKQTEGYWEQTNSAVACRVYLDCPYRAVNGRRLRRFCLRGWSDGGSEIAVVVGGGEGWRFSPLFGQIAGLAFCCRAYSLFVCIMFWYRLLSKQLPLFANYKRTYCLE
ncbi:hypothetical protein BaRGS_00003265 [Batillaria attramentaria]|uniref:Uncharacterized protein n=1 Tax=Batillaria attramentaria TaxID=370345 RepID=A0ABD0M0S8_9CAEN